MASVEVQSATTAFPEKNLEEQAKVAQEVPKEEVKPVLADEVIEEPKEEAPAAEALAKQPAEKEEVIETPVKVETEETKEEKEETIAEKIEELAQEVQAVKVTPTDDETVEPADAGKTPAVEEPEKVAAAAEETKE